MSVLSQSLRNGYDATRSFANRRLATMRAGTARGEARPSASVLVGAHHFGAQHRLVEAELTVEFVHRRGRGLQVDHRVDALGMLRDLVRQPALAPDVDLVHSSAILSDDVQKGLQGRGYSALVESGVENDH